MITMHDGKGEFLILIVLALLMSNGNAFHIMVTHSKRYRQR